uniref:DUF2306 domain-containing protein n=1 Tax=uncultured Altererythrobacter sp. TaxID=500840 RepID=UPI0026331CE4|nr:DUF2306 domain-containing protein [uncultured Altererythrobacter sp.]
MNLSSVTQYWEDPLMAGLHVACAFLALVCGMVVILRRKGGKRHKQVGYVYVAAMLAVNISALLQAELTLANPFVIASFASLITVAAAMVCAFRFRASRSPGILAAHGTMMGWSYFGLLTAGLTQSLTASELYAYDGWARHEYGVYTLVALATVWTIWHINRDTKQLRISARKNRARA